MKVKERKAKIASQAAEEAEAAIAARKQAELERRRELVSRFDKSVFETKPHAEPPVKANGPLSNGPATRIRKTIYIQRTDKGCVAGCGH